MKFSVTTLLLTVTFLVFGQRAYGQLPNEKFGKPSDMEWEFVGWGDAVNADALVLCKTMTVTYRVTDQVFSNSETAEIGYDDLPDFGKNQIDESSILVKYEFRLRTKILKPEGASHANIDIVYFNADNAETYNGDELADLKVRVFTKNEKGKVEKRNISTGNFVRERLDNNYMVLHVAVPDVKAGSIIEYQYNITSNRPTFLYDWKFQESIPVVRSKCDIDIPAFLQFNMNVPTNPLVKSGVEVGRLTYDTNRADLKRGKSCVTNHYKMTGDYILPDGPEVGVFTSQITTPNVSVPAYLPKGSTHLWIK